MKILVAIKSTGKPEQLAHTTFRWAARAGFDIRIFVPEAEVAEYQEGIDDANYHYYLVGRDETEVIVSDAVEPWQYARAHGYDLLLFLPDDLLDYSVVEDDDQSMADFATDAGAARSAFKDPELKRFDLEKNNSCVMVRV